MDGVAAKQVEGKIEQHRNWLARQSEQSLNRWVPKLHEAIKDQNLFSLSLLADATRSLASNYGTRGIVKLHDGHDGWPDIAAAMRAYHVSVRAQFKVYYSWFAPERPNLRSRFLHRLPTAVCMLAYFMTVGETESASEMWSLLQKALFDSDPKVNNWWYERHFEPFFAALYGAVHGQPAPLDANRWDVNVYASIFENWQNGDMVAAALCKACDYHLNHMENTQHWDAEFDSTPLDLIPAEIHAVNCLRSVNGLAPVEIDHPLVTTFGPFVKAEPPDESLELLSLMEEKLSEFA
jgi:hypothetical protein